MVGLLGPAAHSRYLQVVGSAGCRVFVAGRPIAGSLGCLQNPREALGSAFWGPLSKRKLGVKTDELRRCNGEQISQSNAYATEETDAEEGKQEVRKGEKGDMSHLGAQTSLRTSIKPIISAPKSHLVAML